MSANIVMGWSECSIEIGATGASEAMAIALQSVGVIKDKSSTLEATDGEVLEMKRSGGKLFKKERLEGGFVLKSRIVEPSDELFVILGLGQVATDELEVKTHIVNGDYSVKVTPKNVGAKGIKAPRTSVSFKPGWSEADGHYVDIEFDILQTQAGKWYSRFTKTAV